MVCGVGCFIFLMKSGCSWEKNWWAITIFMIKSERFPPNFFSFLSANTSSFPNLRGIYVSLAHNKDYKPFISIWSVPSVNQTDSDKAKVSNFKTHPHLKNTLAIFEARSCFTIVQWQHRRNYLLFFFNK